MWTSSLSVSSNRRASRERVSASLTDRSVRSWRFLAAARSASIVDLAVRVRRSSSSRARIRVEAGAVGMPDVCLDIEVGRLLLAVELAVEGIRAGSEEANPRAFTSVLAFPDSEARMLFFVPYIVRNSS